MTVSIKLAWFTSLKNCLTRGKDVTTYCYDMENFRAEVDVVPSSVFYSWGFGFGGDVVINGPANVKEEYKQLVQKVAERL